LKGVGRSRHANPVDFLRLYAAARLARGRAPYFGIDINLPALSATGATLSASASDVGLTMSAFVLSLAVMPLMYGPASDRFDRKPMVLHGIQLFAMGSVACALAPSLPVLLACRVVQGVGAAAMGTIFAIIRDLSDGNAARIKIANVMVAVNVATMVAPTARATLLTLGNWRLIYAVQAGIGLILLLAVLFGLSESARIDLTLSSPEFGDNIKLSSCADASGFLRMRLGRRSFRRDGVCLRHRCFAVLYRRG
jgi:MFS family permease